MRGATNKSIRMVIGEANAKVGNEMIYMALTGGNVMTMVLG